MPPYVGQVSPRDNRLFPRLPQLVPARVRFSQYRFKCFFLRLDSRISPRRQSPCHVPFFLFFIPFFRSSFFSLSLSRFSFKQAPCPFLSLSGGVPFPFDYILYVSVRKVSPLYCPYRRNQNHLPFFLIYNPLALVKRSFLPLHRPPSLYSILLFH